MERAESRGAARTRTREKDPLLCVSARSISQLELNTYPFDSFTKGIQLRRRR